MQVKEWDLQSKLATGKLAPVYFIGGDEALLVQEACDHVIAAATAAGYLERTVIHVDASYRWTDLLADASSMSLFSSQRLLDVRVAGGKIDRDASEVLREYCAQPPEDTVLLIRSARDSKHRKSAWYKAIDKLGVTVTIYEIGPAGMPKWLQGRVRDAGLQLRDDALQYLSERVEGNLLAAVQEVQKLKLLDLPAPITLESLMDATEDASNYGVFDV
ncbi:MAG: DNA polymerase III subunit delta, partial [Pseudomonadales bacterium]